MPLIFHSTSNREFRRSLRRTMTPAEVFFWKLVRGRLFRGLKFRRQAGVGPYVVDFYCPATKLVIEIDGDSHFTADGVRHDQIRTHYLEAMGLTVLRFTNADVLERSVAVLDRVWAYSSICPSSERRDWSEEFEG